MERMPTKASSVRGSRRKSRAPQTSARGQLGSRTNASPNALRITDKTIDFLGFQNSAGFCSLAGRSKLGRHDTRDLSTGVESGGVSRSYEFGDTLNMDISATLFTPSAARALKFPSR